MGKVTSAVESIVPVARSSSVREALYLEFISTRSVVVGNRFAWRVEVFLLLVGHGQVPRLGLHERRMLAVRNDNAVEI